MRKWVRDQGIDCPAHITIHGKQYPMQQAVEYYESNNDKRYRVYQRRLERFLKKQNIDDILRGKSGELVSKKDTAEKQIIHAVTKSRSEVGKLIDRS